MYYIYKERERDRERERDVVCIVFEVLCAYVLYIYIYIYMLFYWGPLGHHVHVVHCGVVGRRLRWEATKGSLTLRKMPEDNKHLHVRGSTLNVQLCFLIRGAVIFIPIPLPQKVPQTSSCTVNVRKINMIRRSYTNKSLYACTIVVTKKWFTDCLGHGHGYECHSP